MAFQQPQRAGLLLWPHIHRRGQLRRSRLAGANFLYTLAKQIKCSWEEWSYFQLNLAKNLLHDWVEVERKFSGESLPLPCTKIFILVQNEAEFWLFLLCMDLIPSGITLSGQSRTAEWWGMIPNYLNLTHFHVIQQRQGSYHMMSRKYRGFCPEGPKHIKVISGVTITKPM